MKRKYSIIVPVYNAEKYLKKCIDSIMSQGYSNLEIIVVNDGSTDNTSNILEDYKNKDKRLVVINLKNGGVSNARNEGIKKATGDYVTFIDADDYIKSTTIEEIDYIIEKNSVDIVKYNYITKIGFFEKKYQFSIKTSKIITKNEFEQLVYPYVFTTNDLANVWNAFIKLSIAKNVLFDTNLKYAEDSKFMFECLNFADNIYFLDKHMYYYIQNFNSAVNTTDYNRKKIQLENVLKSNLFIYKKINNEQFLSDFSERMFNSISECLIHNSCIRDYTSYKTEIEKIFNDSKIKNVLDEFERIANINIYNQILKMYQLIRKQRNKLKIKKNIKKILLQKR